MNKWCQVSSHYLDS